MNRLFVCLFNSHLAPLRAEPYGRRYSGVSTERRSWSNVGGTKVALRRGARAIQWDVNEVPATARELADREVQRGRE